MRFRAWIIVGLVVVGWGLIALGYVALFGVPS